MALLTALSAPALAQGEAETQGALASAAKPARGAVRLPAAKAGQTRLEVYGPSGELVFDSGFQAGEVNWSLEDASGRQVADGSYRLQISRKGDSGKVGTSEGSVKVESGQVVAQTGVADAATMNVDEAIVFSAPANVETYGRDIHLSDNKGGLRFYAMPSMTNVPQGAALQFFGNQSPYFPGQAFFDSGAHDQAAFIVRTAPSNSLVSERMRVTAFGNVGIGTPTPTERLEVAGNLKLSGAGSGITFADGSRLTSAPTGGGESPTGNDIVAKINEATTTGKINASKLAAAVAKTNAANNWTAANTFQLGISVNNSQITNVGNPVSAGDAANKAYVDANFVKFVPGAEQLSVGDANGTAPMINLRGGATCCSGPGGHTPAWFKVFQNGSFVATGNLGIGVSPMQGKGYRTSWDSYKGAFRSGYADNEWDDATVGFFSWAGGSNSTAEGLYAFAFGDTNFARSTSSIAFGSGNEVKGAAGFSAGAGNRVCDTYGVAFGNKAQSGGPLINGKCDPDTFNIRGLAAVAIGYNVTADQDHTTALGKFASNNGFIGTFIWSDGSATASADTFRNTANNEFAARATGGFRFRTNLGGTTGCNLPAGSGVFNCTSSRTTKENFMAVSGEDILSRMRKVPVSSWNYITEGQQVRHLGPMAEDFHAAFKLGTDEKSIGVLDIAGVSFAAIKALDERTAELQQKTEEVEQLREKVNTLEQRLAALEQLIRAGDKK
ncbi:MAG TPA: tail fiber domain-containing protein [Pyrinomonadaceae bacterium]|nr:tail fiber domain-containing protein [Pyrinomonadaceae bacterium]